MLELGLRIWNLDPNPDAHDCRTKDEQFAKRGWVGAVINNPSAYEYRRMKAYAAERRTRAWISKLKFYNEHNQGGVFNHTEAGAWFSDQPTKDNFLAFVATLPQRTAEFWIEEPPTAKLMTLMRGVNHRVVPFREWAEDEPCKWLVSAEPAVPVVQFKLTVG